MKKALLIIVPLAGAVAIGVFACRKMGACGEEGRKRPDVWARMEEKMAQMPETFPPRVMFDNIAAIREQTTLILELLEHERGKRSAASEDAPKESAA